MTTDSVFQFPAVSEELLQIWKESLLKLLTTPSDDPEKMETVRATGKSLVLSILENEDSWKIGSDPRSSEATTPKSPVEGQKENVTPTPEVSITRKSKRTPKPTRKILENRRK